MEISGLFGAILLERFEYEPEEAKECCEYLIDVRANREVHPVVQDIIMQGETAYTLIDKKDYLRELFAEVFRAVRALEDEDEDDAE